MISTGVVSVGTASTAIDGVHFNPTRMVLQNNDNTDTLYIGGPDVTTSNGLSLLKLETLQLELEPLEQVYVVSTKTGHSMSFLRQTL